jgi:drug/metabolite transporter (DMT)-like permease
MVGGFAAIGQLTMTESYHFAQATHVAIYKYAHILFALLLGAVFFSEFPDWLSVLGGVLIIVAAWLNWHGMRKLK